MRKKRPEARFIPWCRKRRSSRPAAASYPRASAADACSSSRRPQGAARHTSCRRARLECRAPGPVPADFPADELAAPQQVIFSAGDGMRIHGQLFLPRHMQAGERHPAAIFFHGGSRRQMLLGWHYMYYYSNAYAMNQYLASQGYIVLSVNYRSGIGYGLDFREALNYGAMGASEFNDVLGAGIYLRTRAVGAP